MLAPTSAGDVADRISILRLKTERIADPERREHAARELAALVSCWEEAGLPPLDALADYAPLARVNAALWQVEDDLRDCERDGDFGPGFVALARSVYRLNDQRAAHKRAINAAVGSELVEVKSYAPYGA